MFTSQMYLCAVIIRQAEEMVTAWPDGADVVGCYILAIWKPSKAVSQATPRFVTQHFQKWVSSTLVLRSAQQCC